VLRPWQQVHDRLEIERQELVERRHGMFDLVSRSDHLCLCEAAVRDRHDADAIADLAKVREVTVVDGRDHPGSKDADAQLLGIGHGVHDADA